MKKLALRVFYPGGNPTKGRKDLRGLHACNERGVSADRRLGSFKFVRGEGTVEPAPEKKGTSRERLIGGVAVEREKSLRKKAGGLSSGRPRQKPSIRQESFSSVGKKCQRTSVRERSKGKPAVERKP